MAKCQCGEKKHDWGTSALGLPILWNCACRCHNNGEVACLVGPPPGNPLNLQWLTETTVEQRADLAKAGRSNITGKKWSTLEECQAVDDQIREIVGKGGLCPCWLKGLFPRKSGKDS